MKKLLATLLALSLACVSSLAMAEVTVPSPTNQKENVDLFFIQIAKNGSLLPSKSSPDLYELKLQGVDEYVRYFSDRPARIAGIYPTEEFTQKWANGQKALSFNKIPPNAALSAIEPHLMKNKMVNFILQLSDPRYDANTHTLTYTAKILSDVSGPVSVKRMDHVAVFIDSYCASCVGKGF